jgi:hypothetical protein
MAKRKTRKASKEFVLSLRELRTQLHEINQKLDHLIKSYRRFYLTTDFAESSHYEFKR